MIRFTLYLSLLVIFNLIMAATCLSENDLSFLTTAQQRDLRTDESSRSMKTFMRSTYDQLHHQARKKRHLNPALSLAADVDMMITLPNRDNHSHSRFEYHGPLESLTHVELILPIERRTKLTQIEIRSEKFQLSLQPDYSPDNHWWKIDLTQYIRTFPQQFQIKSSNVHLSSSGFLTLYFQRSPAVHSISRRDLSPFADHPTVTRPEHPSHCQVRPFRTTFAEFPWASWIIEPSSYEMNLCSGSCHTNPTTNAYSRMQHLLHRHRPRKISAPCCTPSRFAPIILLYHEGPNLVLKRHENMRVVECACT